MTSPHTARAKVRHSTWSDTPNGAWAEFLRHEGITEEVDLEGLERALWCVDVPIDDLDTREPTLGGRVLRGGFTSYASCRREARRLRAEGAEAIEAPSAALTIGGAGGWIVDGGEHEATRRDGKMYVLFGRHPECVGWPAVEAGAPPARVLPRVRRL